MPKYSTKQRKVLLDYLTQHPDEPLSARQIADATAGDGISLSAIYRNIAAMETEGILRPCVRDGSREVLYRFCGAAACHEHLHMTCSHCGKTYHMDVPATQTLVDQVAEDAGFRVDRSATVLYGVCRDCCAADPKTTEGDNV